MATDVPITSCISLPTMAISIITQRLRLNGIYTDDFQTDLPGNLRVEFCSHLTHILSGHDSQTCAECLEHKSNYMGEQKNPKQLVSSDGARLEITLNVSWKGQRWKNIITMLRVLTRIQVGNRHQKSRPNKRIKFTPCESFLKTQLR